MQRKVHSSEFKAMIVLKILSGEMTAAEIAKRYKIHPLMITRWKKQAVDLLHTLFAKKTGNEDELWKQKESELFQQIGQLQYELDWLKKKVATYNR